MTPTIRVAIACAAGVLACKRDVPPPSQPTTQPAAAEPAPSPLGEGPAHARVDADLPAPVLADPASIKWVEGPDSLPKGARVAILEGAPPFPANKTFTMMAKVPPQYMIPPHTHPATERVTVLAGKLYFGHGPTIDKTSAKEVAPGGTIMIPAGHTHYAFSQDEETVIVLQGVGPWNIYYVDPANDPRPRPAEKPATITRSPFETEVISSISAPSTVAFTEPPAGMLPAGAKLAVLEGDPNQAKTFMIRLKFPDGYRVPVHAHSISDRFTVLQGELKVGIGKTFEESVARTMPAGSVGVIPRNVEHYAVARGETVIQIFGVGPFDIRWSHAVDDPAPSRPPM